MTSPETVPINRRLPAPDAKAAPSISKARSAHEMVAQLAAAMQEVIAGLSDRIKKLDSQVKNVSFRSSTYTDDVFQSLADRMAELEQRKAASMVYRGQFNRTSAYEPGDLVVVNEKLYVCAKAVEAGGHVRDGSDDWVKVFSKAQNHD